MNRRTNERSQRPPQGEQVSVPSLVEVQENIRDVRRAVENRPGANQSHENPEIKFILRTIDYLAAHIGALYEALPDDKHVTINDVQAAAHKENDGSHNRLKPSWVTALDKENE
jgi:hypothetical protein